MTRPPYGIDSVTVGNREVAVSEEAAHVTPFGTLLHFKKDIETAQPRVLVVAPLSGHFATLLRDTVRTMLPEHDVYITDWHNARDVAPKDGALRLRRICRASDPFLEVMGPGAHIVAVCQPCVAALVARRRDGAGRQSGAAAQHDLDGGADRYARQPDQGERAGQSQADLWFEQNLIATVPCAIKARHARVYPGFVQLAAFMSMNIDRHVKAHRELYENIAKGENEKAEATRTFYDEYFAVLDLTAEFYLETVRIVFQEHALPRGELDYRGSRVEPPRSARRHC